jgi:2-dehydro-3-deoxy-D-arabinonate dehydratase
MNQDPIVQVIGVAYTYRPSLAVRRHLTQNLRVSHSSKDGTFSYFYKGDRQSIVGHRRKLCLRSDPISGELAAHWPEPELAILLGPRHQIAAYTLANDLTAISVEAQGRTTALDGTYAGKVWDKSGSLGPRFVDASSIPDPDDLVVGLRIKRDRETIYDQTYHTSRRTRPFAELPELIVSTCLNYGSQPPPSKRLTIGADNFLPSGTVIMLGSGLIVRKECFCRPGDVLTVYCPAIGELENQIA